MKNKPGKFRVKVDGLPSLSFQSIEGQPEQQTRTQQIEDVVITDHGCPSLEEWYWEALTTKLSPPWIEPRGIITLGVEAWELGECVMNPPRRLPNGNMEMAIRHSARVHGYYFTCPHCDSTVRPITARCHGPKMAMAVQCPGCGVPSLVSLLKTTPTELSMVGRAPVIAKWETADWPIELEENK